jgi:putative heme iron utilization protein
MCPWCPSPFTLLPGGTDFIIHVSQLAAHTKDMLAGPQVSLLVIAPPAPGVMAQELARITVQGTAMQLVPGTPEHAAAKAAYLARFPQSEPMFGFADFSLFAIVPESIRFVGGFAQATTISPETLAEALGRGARS